MEVDVAVLGGGPVATPPRSALRSSGARPRASRRNRSSAAPACASGASRRRPGCRPRTRSRRRRRPSRSSASSSASRSSTSATANEWKSGVVEADDERRREPLQGERRRVGEGHRRVQGREHDRGRGRRGRHVQVRDRRDRLVPDPAADRGPRQLALRRLDRPARPGPRCRAGSSCSAAASSAASSRRSSSASAPR